MAQNSNSPVPQTQPQSGRVWLIAMAVGALWVAYMMLFGPNGRFSLRAGPALTASGNHGRADAPWFLCNLESKTVDFQQFRGRPIFLNLWATWCPPCVAEMPSINRLAGNLRVKDVVFLCVSVEEDRDVVRRFAQENQLSVPVYYSIMQPPPVFQTDGIPATFIIDRDGKVVAKEVGSANWDSENVIAILEKLAK